MAGWRRKNKQHENFPSCMETPYPTAFLQNWWHAVGPPGTEPTNCIVNPGEGNDSTSRGVIWGGWGAITPQGKRKKERKKEREKKKKREKRQKETMNNVKLLHIKNCFFQFFNSQVALKNKKNLVPQEKVEMTPLSTCQARLSDELYQMLWRSPKQWGEHRGEFGEVQQEYDWDWLGHSWPEGKLIGKTGCKSGMIKDGI